MTTETCLWCDGKGRHESGPYCPACHGTGYVAVVSSLKVGATTAPMSDERLEEARKHHRCDFIAEVDHLRAELDTALAVMHDMKYESSAYARGVEDGRKDGELRWTKGVPSEPGWYWWRAKIHNKMTCLIRSIGNWPGGGLVVKEIGGNDYIVPDAIDCEWVGPIPIPAEGG